MSRTVQITVMFEVDDDVTDEQVFALMANVSAQVEEPTIPGDEDGNEVTFVARSVFVDLFVDDVALT